MSFFRNLFKAYPISSLVYLSGASLTGSYVFVLNHQRIEDSFDYNLRHSLVKRKNSPGDRELTRDFNKLIVAKSIWYGISWPYAISLIPLAIFINCESVYFDNVTIPGSVYTPFIKDAINYR